MSLIQTAFAVRPREQRRVAYFWLIGLSLAIAANIGGTASTALFIRRYGVEHLPEVFVLTSVCVMVAMSAYDAFAERIPKERYMVLLLGLSAAAALSTWLVAQTPVSVVYLVLYPVFSVSTLIAYTQFGTILFDYFDTLESKRLFSVVFSSTSVGAFLGGLGTKGLLRWIETSDLLLIWLLFLVLTAIGVALHRRVGVQPVDRGEAKGRKRKSSLGFFEGLRANTRAVLREPLVRHIVLASATVIACNYVIQYLTSKIFDQAYPVEADLTAFLGLFSAMAAVVVLLVETAVVPRMMSWLGVGRANLVYPLLLIASLGGLLMAPILGVAILAFFTRRYLSRAVGDTAGKLLLNGLPQQLKGRVVAFVNGYSEPVSIVLVSLLILAVNRVVGADNPRSVLLLAGIGLGLGVVHLVQKDIIRRHYVAALVALVKDRRLDLAALSEDAGGDAAAEVPVEDYLRSDDDTLVATVLHYARSSRTDCSAALRAVFDEKPPDVQNEILDVLASRQGRAASDFLVTQARRGHPEVRAAAIDHLARLDDGELVAQLGPYPSDSDDVVRRATLAALLRCGNLEEMAFALGELGRRLDSPDATEMLGGVDVARRTGDGRLLRSLRGVVERWEGAPRGQVIAAMSEMERGHDDRNVRLFHDLLRTGQRGDLAPVMAALGRIASPATVPVLEERFAVLDPVNRLRAVGVLRDIGPAAGPTLERVALDPREEIEVRLEALGALEHGSRDRARGACEALLDGERRAILRLLAQEAAAERSPGAPELMRIVVSELLASRVTLWLHAAARLVPRSHAAQIAVDDALCANPVARANALETLENLLGGSRWRMIAPALDDLPASARLAALSGATRVEPPDLAWFRDHAPTWFWACALACDGAAPAEILDEARQGDSAPLREAAAIAAGDLPEGGVPMLSTFERVVLLKRVPIFSRLDSRALGIVAGISTEEEFSEGDSIFEEGDAGDAMYVIQRGNIRLWQGAQRDLPLLRLGPADFFGEMSILSGEPRTASAAADADSVCLRIEGERFQKLLIDYPLMCMPIFAHLLKRLGDSDARVAAMRAQLDRTQLDPTEEE